YWIVVDGYNDGSGGFSSAAAGSVTVHWALTASAPVISSFSPASGTVGTAVTINGANFTAPVYVKLNGIAATGTFNSTTITATVPAGAATGPITVMTPGGTASSRVNFIVLSPPSNDNFANAQLISGNSGTVTTSNVDATKEAGEPNHAGNTGGKSV